MAFLTKLGLLSVSDLICKLLVVDIYGHMYTFVQFPLGVTMVMDQTSSVHGGLVFKTHDHVVNHFV